MYPFSLLTGQVDAKPLIFFRICFGLIMMVYIAVIDGHYDLYDVDILVEQNWSKNH